MRIHLSKIVWLLLSPMVAFAMPKHWLAPITASTQQITEQKTQLIQRVERMLSNNTEKAFVEAARLWQLSQWWQQEIPHQAIVLDLKLMTILELIGLIESNQNEHFDFNQSFAMNPRPQWMSLEDGHYFEFPDLQQIKDPKDRAQMAKNIEAFEQMKEKKQQYEFESELKREKSKWLSHFHTLA